MAEIVERKCIQCGITMHVKKRGTRTKSVCSMSCHMKLRYYRRKQVGMCGNCGKNKAAPGKTQCNECRRQVVIRASEKYYSERGIDPTPFTEDRLKRNEARFVESLEETGMSGEGMGRFIIEVEKLPYDYNVETITDMKTIEESLIHDLKRTGLYMPRYT